MSTSSLSSRSRAFVNSGPSTTAVILCGAVLVGLEAYPALVARFVALEHKLAEMQGLLEGFSSTLCD